jgi:copper chaperone CopZ
MKISFIFIALAISFSLFAAKVEVEVKGMTCGMCVEAITKELKATEKVENVAVNLDTKKASFEEIKGKTLNDAEVKAAIKKAGYEAVKINRK